MMEKVKIGLLGLVLVLVAYNIVQVSSIKNEVTTLKDDMSAGFSLMKTTAPATPIVPTASPNKPINNLPKTDTKPVGPSTAISFAEELHDFGTVELESENLYAFTFTNTGNEPLMISNAKGSCGCTVPNWPKQPIMPGESGTIDVKYTPNAAQVGKPVEKTVTVTANTNPVNTIVRIKANVIDK